MIEQKCLQNIYYYISFLATFPTSFSTTPPLTHSSYSRPSSLTHSYSRPPPLAHSYSRPPPLMMIKGEVVFTETVTVPEAALPQRWSDPERIEQPEGTSEQSSH